MTWAFFRNSNGKLECDLYAFARGQGIISEHATRQEAVAAKLLYEAKAEEEERLPATQRALFGEK